MKKYILILLFMVVSRIANAQTAAVTYNPSTHAIVNPQPSTTLIGNYGGKFGPMTNTVLPDIVTNTFSGNTLHLGTNCVIVTSSDITITGVDNVNPNQERYGVIHLYGVINISASSNININTPGIWYVSDGCSTTRVLSQGHTMDIAVDVIPGQMTNAAIVQYSH